MKNKKNATKAGLFCGGGGIASPFFLASSFSFEPGCDTLMRELEEMIRLRPGDGHGPRTRAPERGFRKAPRREAEGRNRKEKEAVPVIDLQNVSKTYAKGGKLAVNDLTLHVEGGELFGFIGPNGAGKTTTIKLMTGILKPDGGSVTMAGHPMDSDRLAAQRLIGFVPDGNDLYDRLTGIEYLNFMADIYQVSAAQRKAHIEKYLDLFSLEDAINNQIRSYSKGMKQKLVVIGALIHNPPIWILDEPLGGLDPRAAHLLKEEMIRHCREGNTVFFSTHVLEVAEKLCTRIGIIAEGSLKAQGTLEELRSGETGASLEELFLELTDTEEGEEK